MLFQSQSHSLRPLTTAHLAQTMTLLELPGDELRQHIETALASNPALELAEEQRCPHCHRILPRTGPCPACSAPTGILADEAVVFVSPRQDFSLSHRDTSETYNEDDWTAEIEDLPTFVLRQIGPELDPDDRLIAAHLLTSLDEDGLLNVPLTEIARYRHVPISKVQEVQQLIQHSEPIGVGSSTPQEALLIQLEVLAETQEVPPMATSVILKGIDLLSRRAYSELSRQLNISTNQVIQIARFISDNLNPYPARSHWGDIHQGASPTMAYQDPDVVITQFQDNPESPLVVEIISPYAGSLRVNPLFRQALGNAPEEKSDQWQDELEEAVLLVKCLQQRNNTLVRLMQRLVSLQRPFILEGDAHLKSFTRARLAEELNLHESTISRAVAGKSVQLPNRRIIPLSKWFDRSLNARTALLDIISRESSPLSDSEIAELLAQKGFIVARRTVAKYRNMEGVLPARLRRPNTLTL